MKTQILIEEGRAQIVLTPETEFEKTLVGMVDVNTSAIIAKRGEFGLNRAGYLNEFDRRPQYQSLVVLLKPEEDEPALASMERQTP